MIIALCWTLLYVLHLAKQYLTVKVRLGEVYDNLID